jgi:hypothetical protein
LGEPLRKYAKFLEWPGWALSVSSDAVEHMKRLGFLVILISVSAHSQMHVSHGTILVSTMTKNEVTIAEDSRVMEDRMPKDDDCKIITLGGKMIFGFTGTRTLKIRTKPIPWEAHDSAEQAYRMAIDGTAYNTATQFGNLAKRFFEDAIKAMGLQEFGYIADPRAIGAGLFADISPNGTPEQVYVALYYSYPSTSVEYAITNLELVGLPTRIFADGSDTTVVTEFRFEQTARAKKEVLRWQRQMASKSPDEKAALLAGQLATWEILYGHDPEIGGDVDYMVVTRTGISDHRKESCKNNN